MKVCFSFFVNPFDADVTTDGCPMPESFLSKASVVETELLELQEDLALKMVHKSLSTVELWKQVPEAKHPNLKKPVIRLISIFSSTYCCESFYSVIKFVKSKYSSVLTNQHLKELLRTALTSYQPNFKHVAAQVETGDSQYHQSAV